MSQIGDWIQTNWYGLGSLLIQCGILASLIWYARRTLRTIRASQHQMETLLSLSLTPGATAPGSSPAAAENTESAERSVFNPLRSAVKWLEAPMGSGNVHPWRRVIRWLQAPAGS